MFRLFRIYSSRYIFKNRIRTFLSVSSIALGVAMFVSFNVNTKSIERALSEGVDNLLGNAVIEVSRGQGVGVEEDVLKKLDKIDGIIASPVISATVSAVDLKDANLMIMGIDFKRDASIRMYKFKTRVEVDNPLLFLLIPNAIVVGDEFAQKNSLKSGSTFKISTPSGLKTATVTAIMAFEGPAKAANGNFGAMDIHAMQKLFKKEKKFDKVEIALKEKEDVDAAIGRISNGLGGGYVVRRVSRRSNMLDDAMLRLEVIMSSFSVIALLVSLFIIYNSISVSVVERAKEIGTLRAIGATRWQIIVLFALEALFLGLVGWGMGLVGGVLLSKATIAYTSDYVNQLTYVVTVREIVVTADVVAVSFVVGVITSLIASFLPALDATRVSPISVLRKATYQFKQSSNYMKMFVIGVGVCLVTFFSLRIPASMLPEVAPLILTVVGLLGCILMIPQISLVIFKLSEPCLGRMKIEGKLAANNLMKFPGRTTLTIVAFGCALSMVVITSSVVNSFEVSLVRWFDDVFPFDLTVTAGDFSNAAYSQEALGEDVIQTIEKIPGVKNAYGVRATLIPFHEENVMLISFDTDRFYRMHVENKSRRITDKSEHNRTTLPTGNYVLVSDGFSRLYGIGIGGRLALNTPNGPQTFEILDEIEDYSWPRGTIFIDRGIYKQYYLDETITYCDVDVDDSVGLTTVKSSISKALKDNYHFFIFETQQIKDTSINFLHQILPLAYTQIVIAVVIGVLGIMNSLLISVMSQTREIGILRAIGSTSKQIVLMIFLEAIMLGFTGAFFGIVAGLACVKFPMSLLLLKRLGLVLPFIIFPIPILVVSISALLIGAISSVVPSRFASRIRIVEAIGYE